MLLTRRGTAWTLGLLLVVAGCGTDAATSTTAGDAAPPASETTISTTSTTATSAEPPVTVDDPATSPPDLEVFIAAIAESLEGTSFEGAPLDDPEVFIGVGQLFCELLAEGLSVDEALAEYLTALEDPDDGASPEDNAFVSGVIMGASLEVLCPDQAEAP